MSDSVLQHILFWSFGYGSLAGLVYAPLLMQQVDSWFLRLVMVGLSVPVAAFLTTALSVSVYGYGVFMQMLSGILVQPLFMHSMIHTVCLSLTLFSGYNLFMKSVENKEVSEAAETESETAETETEESENESDQTGTSEAGSETSEAESENESDQTGTSEAESENESDSKNVEEVPETSGFEWRATANFEGLRTAPPLPE